MQEVIMPKLGLTMETGVIEKWHKKEGDKVEVGEALFEVMTDKVSLEVEAYHSGILRKVLRNEGEEVPVTEVIAYIGSIDEEIPSAPSATKSSEGAVSQKPGEKEKVKEAEPSVKASKETLEDKTDTSMIKISPLARNIAKSKRIDISKIKGSGPGGRIVKEDVENYAASMGAVKVEAAAPSAATFSAAAVSAPVSIPAQAAKVKSSTPLKGIRKIIAERLTYSKQNIPHVISTSVMDVDALIALREKIKDKVSTVYGTKITYTDFIIKACATVLAEQPKINASLQDDNHIIYEDVNIGLAVSVEAGLIVPTIYGADRINLFDIARKRSELVEKSRNGKLTIEEVSNGTFTISNLGMFGVRNFTAIINPPQGAILMVGEIYKSPAVVGDKIEIKQFMQISLAVDHRIIDGADGAKYLMRLREIIENPELMLI